MINAAEHFVRGKRQSYLGDGENDTPDHIGKIVAAYQNRTEEPRYSPRVPLSEIADNLNVSRYVSTAQAEPDINLAKVHASLLEIDAR